MRIRDKIITAACLTPDSIEWTALRLKQDETEPAGQGSLPFHLPEGSDSGVVLESIQLADEIKESLEGDLTASIRTSELLMRTMEFPTSDPVEIAGMVGFQIDKISPFPLDQLATSFEVLTETENGALVLMVAARKDRIDAIGDIFGRKGVHIHSIDARILGWLQLLQEDHLLGSGCEVLIVDDGIDFTLAVLQDGTPIAFRALPHGTWTEAFAGELAEEIGYTLTTLDTEHDLPAPGQLDLWSLSEVPESVVKALSGKTGLAVHQHDLTALPPLSEGIIERALRKTNRIELIPQEWIEHEKLKQLKKKFTLYAGGIGAIWLTGVIILTIIFQTRAIAVHRVQKQEAALAPAANKAIENRKKLRALKNYSDRSDSALECLREVTRLLPPGDIEFVSFNYNEGKGVTVRGTAETDDSVYEFFDSLADSELFVQLKDQRINTRVTKGVQRAVFSVNLMLASEESDS